MKLKILTIGKWSFQPLKELAGEYAKRLGRHCPIEVVTCKSPDAVLTKLGSDDFLVSLDERGTAMDSVAFAKWVGEKQVRSVRTLAFLVGPAEGLSQPLKQRANFMLRLSEMTLQHELALVLLLEQLYRAFSILKGTPYHK